MTPPAEDGSGTGCQQGPEVWITGLGVICAAGSNLSETLANLAAGKRHPTQPQAFESALDYPVFEVRAPVASDRDRSRTADLTVIACREAISHAGLDPSAQPMGCCFGTTVGNQLNDIPFYANYRKTGQGKNAVLLRYLKGHLADVVAREFDLEGPRFTVGNACASGTDALGIALSWIRSGRCTAAIAGGADELTALSYCGFAALGAASKQPCAPFDKNRSGLNLGEGAGVLVLERADSARQRGCRPLARLTGYGNACDGHHLTGPHPDGVGLESAVRIALNRAEVTPDQVAFVNAHGTATTENDRTEGKTLARVFGTRIPILSTKGYTGHTLGAAGGIEAVFSVAALLEGWVPPNAGFETRDDAIPFSPPTEKTAIHGDIAVSVSTAFGGVNAAIVLRKPEQTGERLL